MELQNCGKNRSEDIPDWLLDPTLVIATTNECGTHCTHASKFWSKKLGATPIHFYRQQKNKPRSRFNNLELLHHDDSSDDSGDYCKLT